jgi:hypothetical protein
MAPPKAARILQSKRHPYVIVYGLVSYLFRGVDAEGFGYLHLTQYGRKILLGYLRKQDSLS